VAGPDLTSAEWRRSTHCEGGDCVEVAFLARQIAVRDRTGAVLLFTADEWSAFIRDASSGRFEVERP
jgi:Domain of unknown function (DUF397)